MPEAGTEALNTVQSRRGSRLSVGMRPGGQNLQPGGGGEGGEGLQGGIGAAARMIEKLIRVRHPCLWGS